MRARRDRTDLYKAETQRPQDIDAVSVLVETCREAHAISKAHSKHIHGIGHRRRYQRIELQASRPMQGTERKVVRSLRGHAHQKR